jgi:hypothetical protein
MKNAIRLILPLNMLWLFELVVGLVGLYWVDS